VGTRGYEIFIDVEELSTLTEDELGAERAGRDIERGRGGTGRNSPVEL
jgi:hypothetical protein